MSSANTGCEQCAKLEKEIKSLREELQRAQAEIDRLTSEKQVLQEKLALFTTNSQTSHKPPSSDFVNPPSSAIFDPLALDTDGTGESPNDGASGKGKIGAQPGHKAHFRQPFSAEQVNNVENYVIDLCPCCGNVLVALPAPPRIIQQIDFIPGQTIVTEHRSYWAHCKECQTSVAAPMPAHVEKGGLVGLELTILIAYLKCVCHASFSTVRKFMRDIVKVKISRGMLAKIINKVTASLNDPYNELLEQLPKEAVLNIDETGMKKNRDRIWIWCFRAHMYAVYHVDATRKTEVLYNLLGEQFAGTIGSDYFTVYRKYMGETGAAFQYCLAHLLRDMKFLTTLPGKEEREYGQTLVRMIGELFRKFHNYDRTDRAKFEFELKLQRLKIIEYATRYAPNTKYCKNMAERMRTHGEAYFTFITTPAIGPTNNLAEQAIRFVVIDRKITQGTRSEKGNQWCERIWTVVATCAIQGRSAYEFLRENLLSFWNGKGGISLLPLPL